MKNNGRKKRKMIAIINVTNPQSFEETSKIDKTLTTSVKTKRETIHIRKGVDVAIGTML